MKKISEKNKKKIVALLTSGEIDKAFKQIEKHKIHKPSIYNRLKEEYQAGVQGIELVDLQRRLKSFVSDMLANSSSKPDFEEEQIASYQYEEPKSKFEKIQEKSPWVTGLLALIAFVLGLLGNLMPQEFHKVLKQELGDYYIIAWIGTVIGLIFLTVALQYQKKNKSKSKKIPLEPSQKERKNFIETLKERYQNRLTNKIDERLTLNLEFEYSLDGNIHTDTLAEGARNEKDIREPLLEIAEKHPYLLILGNPGAGKTSQLLNLAVALLEKAAQNTQNALPLIFNLATWEPKDKNFQDWLESNLISLYAYPKTAAKYALENNRIIPLLDGFDEIGIGLNSENEKNRLRKSCLRAIHNFKMQKKSPPQIVICSRIEEYKNADGQAPVEAQILVKNIEIAYLEKILAKPEQHLIQKYRNANQEVLKNLSILSKKEPQLLEVVTILFYFNAMMQVLNQTDDKDLKLPKNKDEIQKFIQTLYVERKINQNENSRYNPTEIKKYLTWLAIWLKKKQSVNFELADFQPKDLINPLKYHLIFFTLQTLVLSIFSAFIFANLSIWSGIAMGILIVLNSITTIIKDYNKLINNKISINVINILQWEKLFHFQTWRIVIFTSIECSVFGGISFALFMFGINDTLVIDACTIGLVAGGLIGIVMGILGGVTRNIHFNNHISKPYQHFEKEIYLDIVSTILFFSLFFYFLYMNIYIEKKNIMYVVINKLSFYLFILAPLILIISSNVFKHFTLRFLLWQEKSTPFCMVDFFNHCVELRLLEKGGGTWRFRHQIIHDYFLELYETNSPFLDF